MTVGSRHIQEAHLRPLRYLCLGGCQHYARREGSNLEDTLLSMASENVHPSYILLLIPSLSRQSSHSSLLPLPVHSTSGAHWLVSHHLFGPTRPDDPDPEPPTGKSVTSLHKTHPSLPHSYST